MQKIIVAAALALGVTATMAQNISTPGQVSQNSLSMDRQRAIGEIITNDQSTPLAGISFSLAIDNTVPANIELRPMPNTAAELAPQFRGLSYVIVEEQIALVDPRSRKIVSVIPRWRS